MDAMWLNIHVVPHDNNVRIQTTATINDAAVFVRVRLPLNWISLDACSCVMARAWPRDALSDLLKFHLIYN